MATASHGSADGIVKLFGAELGGKLEINLRRAKYNVFKWAVKSVCLNKDGRVLVGTGSRSTSSPPRRNPWT